MFGYFYPETNERYLAGLTLASVDEAIVAWRDRASHWKQIEAKGATDKAAFMNPSSGDIVVVREVEQTS